MVKVAPLETADDLQRAPLALRRAFALAAARDNLPAKLHVLTEAWLRLHGRKGARLSPHTAATYRTSLNALCTWMTEHHYRLLTLTHDQAALFARDQESAGKSPSTVAVHLAAARALYGALRWAGVTQAAPFTDVHHAPDPTPPHEKRDPYPDGDVEALIGYAQAQGDLHLVALLLLCAHGGLRAHEAVALTWPQVVGDRVRVVGKGGKRRTVSLSARALEAVSALEATGGRSGDVLRWSSVSGARIALKTACRGARVPYLGLHALRHTCGTRLMRDTGNLLVVARHLGHTDVNTSARYAKLGDVSQHPVHGW